MTRPTTTPVDHPGTFVLEELDARGWSQVDLAFILGMKPQQLSPILNGKRDITPDMAGLLGDAFDMPAEFFANLQKFYDLHKAKPVDPGVKARATWQSIYPVREMILRGWIEDTEKDTALLDLQMLRFFDRNRIEDVPFVGSEAPLFKYAAKKTDYSGTTPVQYAWLSRVKKIAETIQCPLYSEAALRSALTSIRAHMLDPEDFGEIPWILHKCGVRFVVVEALARSKIDGVCVWLGGQPAIGITMRLDRIDNFCFVLRHEIEHVLRKHGLTETFTPVDEFDGDPSILTDIPMEECHANEAASEFCVPQEKVASFVARKSPFISEQDVWRFAARVEIHPAVVIGQIQRHTKNYAWLRKYQTSVKKHLSEWKYIDGWNVTVTSVL
jgi:HTH-type transcriptional regulator/antitoxin HigA